MKQILFSIVFGVFLSVNLFAQTNLLRELLDLPAPPPVAKTLYENGEKRPRSEEFYDKKNVPSDDAPIEDLIDFWKRQNFITASHPNKINPSEKTLARLIESAKENPENLSNFLTLLPETEKISAIVKDIYDTQNVKLDENQRESVKKWLKYKSPYFSDELFAEVQNAKDHKTYKTIGKEEELRALAKVDWGKAESLLKRLEYDKNNPRTAFFAKRLIYEHAVEQEDSATIEKYRNDFQKIVVNKSAPGTERNDALEALIENKEWQNQEDWYLYLFEDETLLELNLDERTTTNPLDGIVHKNPDKWIPVMTKLVGNENQNVRNAAVQALVQFQLKFARKDALLPLLPWLTNPDWAKDTGMGRHRLIQSLDFIDMPESVLSLIWIVENDETYSDWAADSLAKYKDPRAIPAIKTALAKSKDEDERKRFLNGLVASGGLTDDEQLEAIEIYAEKISTREGFKQIEETYHFDEENIPPLQVSIGKYLANLKEPSEGLIRLLIERQKILQKEKPEGAKILSGIMSKWQGRLIDLEILNRIADGRADAETIIGALARRVELKERVSNEIYALRGKSGLASGIAACLTEVENEIISAFHSENVETRIGTLACARLLRKPLPVPEVGALLDSPNKLLALAAERYLESEDSLEARQFVLSKHPGEALILGARDSFNPAKQIIEGDVPLNRLFSTVGGYLSGESYGDFEKFENKLRKELLADSELREIYAVLPNWESNQQVIRIYKNKVVFTLYEDKARYRERVLSAKEIEFLRRTMNESEIDASPPLASSCHHNCYSREFVSLNRNGGRRVFAITGFTVPEPLNRIEAMFQSLAQGEFKTHYYLSDKIKGLEFLLTDKKFQPQVVWKNGDDFRVLVADEERKAQIEDEIAKLNKIDDENEDLDYEIKGKNARQRRIDRAFEHYEWREFKNGKLGGMIDEPVALPFLRDKLTFPAVQNLRSNDSVWQSKSGDYEIRAGEYNEGGLWKTNRSEQIEFKKGVYSNPIVSGNWAVAAKADLDWSAPNYIVRVNLQTGRESKINLPPAEEFYPVAFVAAHHKVLLYRGKQAYSTLNPTVAEYYLLDANTGKTESVKGEFQPLITQGFRPLQPTDKPNEFWATIYSRAKNETDIGVYNTQNFTFKPLMNLPEILLDSTEIWIDKTAQKVYFIYGGDFGRETHLLGLPFPGEQK